MYRCCSLSTPRSCRCALGPSQAAAAAKGDWGETKGTWFPTKRDRRCHPSVEIRLWWEHKAGFNSKTATQLPPWSLCCWDHWRCNTAQNGTASVHSHLGNSGFTGLFFIFCGKGQTNLNLSILHLQPTKSPSYLLWLSPDLSSPSCICKTVP